MHFPLVHFRNKTYRSGGASVGGRENVYCGYWLKGELCVIYGVVQQVSILKIVFRLGKIRPPCIFHPRARCELVSQVLGKHISEGGKISKH